ncbi:MAG: type III pantothenate kinase [Chloroflexota bacterium]
MLLAVDIGNTNITLGVFEGERLAARWRLETDTRRQPDEYALQLQGLLPLKSVAMADVDAVAVCSVVPPLTAGLVEVCRTLFRAEPLVMGAGTKTGVRVLYDPPRDVGTDRVVDAAAALALYGGPAIVVDFGTATVFDAVSSDGAYLGGAIAPGLDVAAESLFQRTAQLRRVELAAPPTAIGRNTVHAMQSGFVYGYAGLVEAMVSRFRAELGCPDAQVIATGGLATLMSGLVEAIGVVDQDLTLKGLRHIFTLNAAAALGSLGGGTA